MPLFLRDFPLEKCEIWLDFPLEKCKSALNKRELFVYDSLLRLTV